MRSENLSVRDLIRGGETMTVEDPLASRDAVIEDRFACRVIGLDRTYRFGAAMLSLSCEASDVLLSSFRDQVARLEETLRNAAEDSDEKAVHRG